MINRKQLLTVAAVILTELNQEWNSGECPRTNLMIDTNTDPDIFDYVLTEMNNADLLAECAGIVALTPSGRQKAEELMLNGAMV